MTGINKWAATLNRLYSHLHVRLNNWRGGKRMLFATKLHPNVRMQNICNTNVIDNSFAQTMLLTMWREKESLIKEQENRESIWQKWRVGFRIVLIEPTNYVTMNRFKCWHFYISVKNSPLFTGALSTIQLWIWRFSTMNVKNECVVKCVGC